MSARSCEHARAVEQTDRDALAVDAGRRRDAHVDVLAGDLAADAAVLRQALLGDVEAGHDLDAREDRVDVVAVGALDLQQVAVDAVADDQVFLARLDVDIRGALLDRLEHQRVDPADDRRLVGEVEDVGELLGLAVHRRSSPSPSSTPPLLARVDLVDGLDDLRRRHDHRQDLGAERAPHVVERVHVERIGDRHLHAARRRRGGWASAVLAREVDRHAQRQLGVALLGLELVAPSADRAATPAPCSICSSVT